MRTIKTFFKCFFVLSIILLLCQKTTRASAEIYEPAKKPKILSFTASSTSIEEGETVILSWNVINASRIDITGLEKQDEEELPSSGSLEVWPLETTTYILTATSTGGSTSSSITVHINSNNDLSIDLFTSSQSEITLGNTVDLLWKTSNAKSIIIIGLEKQDESLPLSGSLEVFPTETTTYILVAVGHNYEMIHMTVTVTVKSANDTESPLIMNMSLHEWSGKYIIDFDIINQSDRKINEWILKLKRSDFDLKFIWGATYTETDEFIIISPLYYNNIINAGDYVSFGFQGYGSPLDDFYYEIYNR